MTRLYFVRHGKTVWNLEGRFQGGYGDSALLEESIADAKKTGKALKEVAFTQAFSSPQKRAKDTATYIIEESDQVIPLTEQDGLREIGFGEWEGQLFSYAEELHPEEYHNLRSHPEKYDPSAFGGEDYLTLIERSQQVIKEAVKKYPNDNLLFVAHGVTLITVIHSLLGENTREIRSKGLLSNTSVSILDVDTNDNYSVVAWNDTSHLEK
ncbi:histidine phosphatase family protein [Carnobacterium gallinarum]|uniref:histidine phosphatase family protein n=1 Tax=Carnobacterium gallinarum TaxID=2749 RepID=UPI000552C3F4|nr:histidine phosphatase family protein [Carnobacterium gallinarum]